MNVEHARAYCSAVGHDPDAVVLGYFNGIWCQRPLFLWMLGTHPDIAAGASTHSPNQIAFLRSRRREAE